MRAQVSLSELKSLGFGNIERIQDAKFHAVAKNLLPQTRFYSSLFRQYGVDPANLKSVEDWHKQGLPLISKFDYMDKVQDFIVQPEDAFKTHAAYLKDLSYFEAFDFTLGLVQKPAVTRTLKDFYHPKMPLFSGGTQSGKPTPCFVTKRQLDNLKGIMKIAFALMGPEYLEETVGMNLFPYGPHLAWHAVHSAFDLGVDLNLATAAGGAMRTKDLVDMADRFDANVFAGMAEYMANRFLPLAVKKKAKFSERAVFINGSEPLSVKDKERIVALAKKLGIKRSLILDFYGASELKEDIFVECLPGSGFHHIAPLSTAVRTVDVERLPKKGSFIEDWDFTEPEEGGAAVVWNIGGAGTMLHGYLLGDKYEKIVKGRCPNCLLDTERIYGVRRLE